jgi:hypothetical protein
MLANVLILFFGSYVGWVISVLVSKGNKGWAEFDQSAFAQQTAFALFLVSCFSFTYLTGLAGYSITTRVILTLLMSALLFFWYDIAFQWIEYKYRKTNSVGEKKDLQVKR